MKKLFFISSIFCSLVSLQAENLTVIVTGLKNSNGQVQISLYNKNGTIPDKELNKYYKTVKVPINNTQAKTVFKDLPKGRYAVSVFHDQNNNNKIDKSFLIPKEGVGLSNFKTINLFHPPSFEKASFFLDSDKKVHIKVIYF